MKGIHFRLMTHRLEQRIEFTLCTFLPYKTPIVDSRKVSFHSHHILPISYNIPTTQEVIALDEDVDKRARCRKPTTRNLSALVFASPISLQLYNASPGLVLDRLSSLTQWALPRHDASMQTYNAANLRLGLAAWEGPKEAQIQKVIKPHIKRMMLFNDQLDLISLRQIAANFNSLVLRGEYDLFLQSRSHLVEFLDLATRAQRLGRRLMNCLHSGLMDQFDHQRPDWVGCIRINPQAIRRTTREDIHEPLLRFQVYCGTFFRQDDVLADEASIHRKAFFTRYDEVSDRNHFDNSHLGSQKWHHHELFYLVLHYIFDEHKNIIRNVARGLGVTIHPNVSNDENRIKNDANIPPPQYDLRKGEKGLREALALENNAARRAQILHLHNRTVIVEDGYCRYMMSFGLDLVERLLRMSPDEKQEYILAEFSRFSMAQEPQACFLENTAELSKWDTNESSGKRWQDSKDQSRMAYTAWFWELAHRAQVGTNFG